jgi:hypothetical protein
MKLTNRSDTSKLGTYEFWDVAPGVFHIIRSMFGIEADEYLASVGP